MWNHNIVLWDWHYFAKYSPHSNWMWGIFYIIMSVPHNIVMDMNNVMADLEWNFGIYLSLKSIKMSCFGRKFPPTFDILKSLRSVLVVLEPLIGKMEGRCLTVAQKHLHKNEMMAKPLKAPKMMVLEIWQGVHLYKYVLWLTSNAFPSSH